VKRTKLSTHTDKKNTHTNKIMRLSLNTILTTYLECVCDGNDFANEDEFRDALVEELFDSGYRVKTEYKIDADPRSGKDYWLIDIMVQTDQNELVPIELKFNEESVQEIQEDIEKIIYLQENYIHMKRGYVILLTNVNPSKYENQLKATINPSYRYAKWYI